MPLVDMPLEQLQQYQGRNPKPHDFEAFWDATLAALDAHDPQAQLVPHTLSAPFAECFHLYFNGLNGSRVHAKYLRPKDAAPKSCAAILMFHGYTGSSGEWADKLSYVARGQSVLALDCRGQGGLSEDRGDVAGNTHGGHIIRGLADALDGRPEKLYYREVFSDTALLARIAGTLDEVDPNRLGATGGSQGGALTLACAALEPRVQKAAPVYPFLCDYQRVWEMDLASGAYAELKTFFRHFDPRHEKEEAIWTALGYIDNQHLAPRIRAHVLMPIGLSDPICPPSTQFAAWNKIPGQKELLVYPDFGHEGLPGSGDAIYDFLGDL
jgi:cephalosporin-C deacetylase